METQRSSVCIAGEGSHKHGLSVTLPLTPDGGSLTRSTIATSPRVGAGRGTVAPCLEPF